MNIPPPSEKQARLLWLSLTALALGILVALVVGLCWASAWMLGRLSSVLIPLAVAGVMACLLAPVVDVFELRLKIPRMRAILMVFFLAVMLVLILLMTVVPQLVVEVTRLAGELPDYATSLRNNLSGVLANSPLGVKAKAAWDAKIGAQAQDWMTQVLPIVTDWLLRQAGRVASWAGLAAGLALTPVYVFYFLLEKSGIQKNWTDYLPIHESRIKDEIVFVISSINDCLIVFFRGQVLVSLCSGTLLAIAFGLIGLPYALLIGALAGLLGVVPYLGVTVSIVPALALAVVHFGNMGYPCLVLVIFAVVQTVEGLVISPRIVGDRVGLHPLTIIIAVMVGTALLGGVLGGMLAIPLTAALRTLMFRYVWRRGSAKSRTTAAPA